MLRVGEGADLTARRRECSISVWGDGGRGLLHGESERKNLIGDSDTVIAQRQAPPVKADDSKCVGCLVCELYCSLRFEKAFNPARAAIEIRRLVKAENEYEVSFNDRCDNCGICVRYCVYGALTQEKKQRGA